MQNLGKWIWLVGSLWFTLLHAATVKTSINAEEVIKGDPISFSIHATGEDIHFPKIENIAGIPVQEAGTSSSMQMSISINGTTQEKSVTKSYTFIPKESMTIPSFNVTIGNEVLKTNPVTIKVLKKSTFTVKTSTRYSFEMKSSKTNLVVGESFIVTLYLYIAEDLGVQQVGEYIEPSASAFFFKDIGQQKQYKKNHFHVIEKQYSVTAKKEGTFQIAPASVKMGVEDRKRRDIFGRYGIRWIGARSNTLDVNVSGILHDTDLVGEFTLVSKVDHQKVKSNKPVNMTITIKGKGNLEDFELPKYEIDGVTVYEDEAKVQSHIENGHVMSIYRKKLVFISEESFVIPKKELSLYNTKKQKVESLVITGHQIHIDAPHTSKQKIVNPVMPKEIVPSSKPQKQVHTTEVKVWAWWMLFVSFLGGMLVMYLGRYIPQKWYTITYTYKESEALKILYAHISTDKEVAEMVDKLYAKSRGDKSIKIDKKILREMVERFR